MNRMLRLAAVFLGLAVASPCLAAVSVTVTPMTGTLAPLATEQLHATVTGSSNQNVTWMVNGIPGGAASIGLVSASGLYTAPADVAAATTVAIEAQADAATLINGTAAITLTPGTTKGPVFVVAPTGKDTNPGSLGSPWRTIQHAVSTVPAGATIEVRAGTYNELVTITRSGSAAAGFLTLKAYPGESPIIDGTGLGIPNGENGLVTITGASFVRLQGFEIRNYKSASSALDPVGIYIYGSGSHIEILENHIHDIVTTVTTSAGDALGIAVYGDSATPLEGVIIDGNELDHLITGFSESLALSGNVVDFQVTGNQIHDNDNIGIDMAGYEQVAPTAYDRARHGWVAGNSVYAITSKTNPAYQGSLGADGIYVDGGTDIVIERNLVHDTDIGIEAASEHKAKFATEVTIRNNIVYHSPLVGLSIGGYSAGVGGTESCVIVNNTLFDNDTTQSGSGEFQIQFHASGNVIRNNILDANAQGLLINSFVPQTAAPASLNDDLYDSSAGAANSTWVWRNVTFGTLAKFQKATGNDHAGHFAAPLFADIATFNFHLLTGSPAIGTGEPLPLAWAGLTDFAGKPRGAGGKIDIGALED
jgi:hypothetical protein